MSESGSSPLRTVLLIIMDVIVVAAIAVLIRVVVEFFGTLASSAIGVQVLKITSFLVPNLGFAPIKTPYGGVFDVNAVIVILILLGVEWVLSIVRRQA
jgi:hypothetical protein